MVDVLPGVETPGYFHKVPSGQGSGLVWRAALGRGQFQNQFGMAVFDLGMEEKTSKSKPAFSPLGVVIILGILALLAAIATPSFNHHGHNSPGYRMNRCINNLRQIDAAKQQWGLENSKTNLDTVVTWNDVRLYLGRGATGSLDSVCCPEDKTRNASNSYTLGDLGSPPECKINPAHILQ